MSSSTNFSVQKDFTFDVTKVRTGHVIPVYQSGQIPVPRGSNANQGNILFQQDPANSGSDVTTGSTGGGTVSYFNGSSWVGLTPGVSGIGDNTFIGLGSGPDIVAFDGEANTSVGVLSLKHLGLISGASGNTAIGFSSLGGLEAGLYNTTVGGSSMVHMKMGNGNTAVGGSALIRLKKGYGNIAIGSSAGSDLDDVENDYNIHIGNNGLIGDNHTIRIGNSSSPVSHSRFFTAGIRGVTTDLNDGVSVLIDSNGQLGTVSSSIRYKENIQDIGSGSDNLLNLRPVTFSYKKDAVHALHYGLIAEEVEEFLPQLVVKNSEDQAETVKYHEICVLLLNEMKKQGERIKVLEELALAK